MNKAPAPAEGSFSDGFDPVARVFAEQLASGAEVGVAFSVYWRGRNVVQLWGGLSDRARDIPWKSDTRSVVFSVTKGIASMALHLLADRGKLEWDAPVTTYWPAFGRSGKETITVRELLNHRAGLPVLDVPFTLDECADPASYPRLLDAIERQAPRWAPGLGQGYHATTFGMYARALFEHVAHESIGGFLQRELFGPLGADVSLGTPARLHDRVATLEPPTTGERVLGIGRALAGRALGRDEPLTELRIARTLFGQDSMSKKAFLNPSVNDTGLRHYAQPHVISAELAWANATASADGIARAYLPFALGGEVDGTRYLRAETLAPLSLRQGWSECDAVLQKPLGWSQGFLKEETHLFSPTRESFGHPGVGGALGWCDPVLGLTIGYVMNKLDWHVRSPRALALTRALYACEPILQDR